MPRGEKKVFECVLCADGHSAHSACAGKYFIESGVCIDCYKAMQKKPASISCFGKLPVGKSFGFSSSNPVCSSICPDRTACALFVDKLKSHS